MTDDDRFRTLSGIPVDAVYGDGPAPGEYPYTRGVHADMYRSRLWTMRMFAGFGTAGDTNARFHDLLKAGGTGLSTAFDMPTLMGRDSDHDWALGEVGLGGELRQVVGTERRLREAARLGFRRAVVPAGTDDLGDGIELVRAATLSEAVSAIGLLPAT